MIRTQAAVLDAQEDPVANNSDPQLHLPNDSIRDMVTVLKLLSDETRLRILFYLMQRKELHVRALCGLLSQSQPAVSHHLALLRNATLIAPRRDGKHNYYRILPDRFQQFIDLLFAHSPGQPTIRFEDYLRSHLDGNGQSAG